MEYRSLQRSSGEICCSCSRRREMKNNYQKKKHELEMLLSLEVQMDDLNKSMLLEKLKDEYFPEDHDGDTTNTQ